MTEHTDLPGSGAQSAMFDMINGYWRTQIVYSAAELGIADLLAHGARSIQALARSTGVDESALYRLMRALIGFGVFTLDEGGQYETTDLGRCLESDAPGRLRARAVLTGKLWYTAWAGLLESIRSGSSTFEHVAGLPLFDHLNANTDVAAVFHETMEGATRDAAREITSATTSPGTHCHRHRRRHRSPTRQHPRAEPASARHRVRHARRRPASAELAGHASTESTSQVATPTMTGTSAAPVAEIGATTPIRCQLSPR